MIDWTPYCGAAPAPFQLAARWNTDPLLLAALGAAFLAILLRSQGRARALGLAGLMVLALGFVSPLCALSSALFSARTVHHLLLVCVAAPLFALSLPRRAPGGLAAATLVQTVLFWIWHAPPAYAAALSHDAVYWLMQLSLFAPALWFWTAVRAGPAAASVAALLAAMVQMGLLGALLTFAGRSIYEPHALSTLAWGLSPLEDQHLAGLIMWAPAALLYMGAALALLGRWIGPDRRPEAAAA